MKFGKGMNDSFESVKSRVLTTIPLPDFKPAFNRLLHMKDNNLVEVYLHK